MPLVTPKIVSRGTPLFPPQLSCIAPFRETKLTVTFLGLDLPLKACCSPERRSKKEGVKKTENCHNINTAWNQHKTEFSPELKEEAERPRRDREREREERERARAGKEKDVRADKMSNGRSVL